jgi:hypothetical protein
MVEYVSKIAEDLGDVAVGNKSSDQFTYIVQALATELNRLDPRNGGRC